jgi:hypothetical protein
MICGNALPSSMGMQGWDCKQMILMQDETFLPISISVISWDD